MSIIRIRNNNEIGSKLLIGFFFIGAISMIVMSLHFFQNEISGILKYKEISSDALYRVIFKAHIFFGLIAITTGPSQFLSIRKGTLIRIHRGVGYIYIVSVFISAMMGFIVAQYAMGGMVSTIGFSVLAFFWMITAVLAMISIKKKQITEHKKWMYINYGLTFAAITQRTLLLVPLLIDVDFLAVYKLSAWLPWIFNTFIAVALFKKSQTGITQKFKKT